jgi:hypothetical protein
MEELYSFEKFVVHNIGYIKNDILVATCYAASDIKIVTIFFKKTLRLIKSNFQFNT